jgi:phosphotriesterase-related protein
MLKKINTALGEIDVNSLGQTLCHEHVVCMSPSFYSAFGKKWLDLEFAEKRAVEMFRQAKDECGLTTVVDGTPIDLYRDVNLIKSVSKQSGVNFIVSSGIYYNESLAVRRKDAKLLAEMFIDECKNGILDTGVKPGILKCATDKVGVTGINANLLSAIAITHNETGLPIYAHNENREQTAYSQLEIFEKYGVDTQKLIIGHCSDTEDIDYLTSILDKGCYLGFDRIYPSAYERQAKTIACLINKGYDDKILVSHDFYACSDTGADKPAIINPNRNFTTVHKKLLPKLRELGIAENSIKKLTLDNPKNFFSR